jgi:predicted helicase
MTAERFTTSQREASPYRKRKRRCAIRRNSPRNSRTAPASCGNSPSNSSRTSRRRARSATCTTPSRSPWCTTRREEEFADAFAQTITYGLLTARWLGNDHLATTGEGFTRQSALKYLPAASPFLNDLFKSALSVKIDDQRGRLLWLIDDVADLLDRIDVTYVFGAGDKDSDTATDPVIHFYELFLAAYDKELKNKRGVFFTPRPVVSYIVRSVHEQLQKDFGLEDGLASTDTWNDVAKRVKSLKVPAGTKSSDPFVCILDPATGTGTFLFECIETIERTMKERWRRDLQKEDWEDPAIVAKWKEYVSQHLIPRLFGYELMMASYAIAHLKLSLKLQETGYRIGPTNRLELYLTNTLEPPSAVADPKLATLFETLASQAQAVNEAKRHKRFTVIIGNPPYAGLSANMSDHAQQLVDAYKMVDGEALNERKLWLQDDYVKFVRVAQTTIETTGAGVWGFITNHGYVDNPTFRGMRRSLMRTFGSLRLLDLHGNANKKEVTPDGSEDKNVFDIRQGVAICVGTRIGEGVPSTVAHADLWGDRETKYVWLTSHSGTTTNWSNLKPDAPFYFFEPQDISFRDEYDSWWRINDIFPINSAGFITARDHFVMDFDKAVLLDRMSDFADSSLSDSEIRRKYFEGCGSAKYPDGDTRGWKVPTARKRLQADKKWRDHVRTCLYRPFDHRVVYWTDWMVDWSRPELTRHLDIANNYALITTRITKDSFAAFATRCVPGHKTVGAYDVNYVFPLLVDPSSGRQTTMLQGSGPQPNIAAKFGEDLAKALGLGVLKGKGLPSGISHEDVFRYVYAICHSESFRERYAEFLKVDFPRIPMPASVDLFRDLARAGAELLALHLMEGNPKKVAAPAAFIGSTTAEVEKISHSSRTVWIDKKKTTGFRGVPDDVWNFHVGGFQVCEKWLKDRRGRILSKSDIEQYQKIVVALGETIRLMRGIDETVVKHGGWPGAFVTKPSAS